MTTTVRDLITDALGEIGVVAGGEAPAYEDSAFALRALNRMVDQWAAEPLLIYHLDRVPFTLQSGVGEYRAGTPGPTPLYSAVVTEGFDTTWAGTPPNWTSVITDTGTITNDTASTQAGGHSVLISGGVGGTASIYRDFRVVSGSPASIDIYYKCTGSPAVAGMKVQIVETGHYLTSAGAWQAASTYAVSNSLHASFFLTTISFTVEDEALTNSDTCTLRITLDNQDAAGVYWDSLTVTNTVEGVVVPSIPIPWLSRIESVSLLDNSVSPAHETPLTMLTEDAWAQISEKDREEERPQGWFYNQEIVTAESNRVPVFFGTLHLYPIPTGDDLQCVLYARTQVTEFTSLSNIVFLPPGYREMIVSNLALWLCPAFSRTAHPALIRRASESKSIAKRANVKPSDLQSEAAALIGNRGGAYDIRRG